MNPRWLALPLIAFILACSSPASDPAEAYHQNFVANHPDRPYVRAWALPKLAKLRALYPELLKTK